MTLEELVSNLMFDAETSDEEERLGRFEVRIEVPMSAIGEPHLQVKGVRWEHPDQCVVIEATE